MPAPSLRCVSVRWFERSLFGGMPTWKVKGRVKAGAIGNFRWYATDGGCGGSSPFQLPIMESITDSDSDRGHTYWKNGHTAAADTHTHPPAPTIDPSTHRTHRHPSIHPKPNIPFIRHYSSLSTPFIIKQDFHQTPFSDAMTNISPESAYIRKYLLSGNHRQNNWQECWFLGRASTRNLAGRKEPSEQEESIIGLGRLNDLASSS